jgi:hypothetical protein
VDYNSGDGYWAGISAVYIRSALNLEASQGSSTTDSFAIAVNAGIPLAEGRLDANALYMFNNTSAKRLLTPLGQTQQALDSQPNTQVFGGAVQYSQPLFGKNLSAFARASAFAVTQQAFTESGAQPFNFTSRRQTHGWLYGDLGLRYSEIFRIKSGTLIIPEIMAGAQAAMRPGDLPVVGFAEGLV